MSLEVRTLFTRFVINSPLRVLALQPALLVFQKIWRLTFEALFAIDTAWLTILKLSWTLLDWIIMLVDKILFLSLGTSRWITFQTCICIFLRTLQYLPICLLNKIPVQYFGTLIQSIAFCTSMSILLWAVFTLRYFLFVQSNCHGSISQWTWSSAINFIQTNYMLFIGTLQALSRPVEEVDKESMVAIGTLVTTWMQIINNNQNTKEYSS